MTGTLRRLAAISTFFLLFIAGQSVAEAEEFRLRVHHFLPTSSTTHQFLVPWAEKLEAASSGRLKLEIYPAMQLGGKPPQLYDQARDGVVDIVWTLPGYTPGRFPVSSVFELPFMVDTAEAASQATQEFAEKYLEEEFADIHLLMLHAHARGKLHLKGKPVTRMEDLVGAKIRAPNKAIADALEALGASPVFMPVTQVAESLSRSVIDGAALPFEITRPLKIHELVDSHTEVPGAHGIYTALFILAMNKASYEKLPPDLRKIIDDTTGLPMAKEVGRMWDEAEALGRQAAVERGNAFNTLSPEEAKRWEAKTESVIAGWVADMDKQGRDGAALLEAARALIAKYSATN